MKKQTILYLPAGEINPHGNGAAKRSSQIHELLAKHYNLINIADFTYSFPNRIKKYQAGLKFLLHNNYRLKSLKNIALAGYYYLNIKKNLEAAPNHQKILCWESVKNRYAFIPDIFKDLGYKLIAFPHNMESLVPDQTSAISGKISPFWFDEEIHQLKQSDHVFTISREEHWLLTLFGISCDYYPYYPIESLEKELLNLRGKRSSGDLKNYFLIFGSYFYAPIQKGMNELIDFIVKNNVREEICIAGFGSEKITEKYHSLPANVKVLGKVSPEQLKELLLSCKAVIVNQQASTGALTKLIELQLIGIPYIINEASTRSQPVNKGIYIYYDQETLIEYILISELSVPALPVRNTLFEKQIIKVIEKQC